MHRVEWSDFLSLIAIIDFTDHHGEAITAIFTILLAIFTARLWFSTENSGMLRESPQKPVCFRPILCAQSNLPFR